MATLLTSIGQRRSRPVWARGPAPKTRLVRRKSNVAGWGVFTQSRITKNTRIIDYAGERITSRQSERREQRHLKAGRIWCFAVSRRHVIDASVGGNLAKFINHSCRPNCYSQVIGGVIWIRAARNIRAGEELTYRYHTNGAAGLRCLCRAGCRTVL